MECNLESIFQTLQSSPELTDAAQQNISILKDQFLEERNKRSSVESLLAAKEINIRSLESKVKDLEQQQTATQPSSQPFPEKQELLWTIEKKNGEICNLREEVDRLNEKSKALWSSICANEESVAQAKSKAVSLQIELSSAQAEGARCTELLQAKEAEYSNLHSSFAEFRKAKTGYIVELEGRIEGLKQQVDSLSAQCSIGRAKCAELEGKQAEQATKEHALKISLLEQEENFKNEIASQTRLVELFQSQVQELEQKNAKTKDSMLTVQRSFEQEQASLSTKVQELEKQNILLKGKLQAREEELEALRLQIENGFMHSLSPTAGMVDHMEKTGKSFSEVYADYLRLQRDLLKEQHEKENLKDCLDEMVKDIEKNAPSVYQNQQELTKTKQEIASLVVENSQCRQEAERLRQELEQISTQSKRKERECRFKEQQVQDLSRQVQVLLAQLEGDSDRIPKEELSEKLIDFKNISELQQQNQKLLLLTRQLSDQINQLNNAAPIAELQQKLANSLSEVESLREARQRQAELVQQLVSQAQVPLCAHNAVPEQKIEDFEAYKREKNEIYIQLDHQITALRQENSQLRIEAYKASSQLENLSERQSDLQERMASLKQENQEYSSKNERLNGLLAEYQQKIRLTLEEMLQFKGEASKQAGKMAVMQMELDAAKSSVSRLIQETGQLHSEKQRLSEILSNLQILQSRVEGTETESRQRLISQLEHAEQELFTLRGRVVHEMEYSKSLLHNFEREKSEYQKRVVELNEAKANFTRELALANANNEQLTQRIQELSNSERRLSLFLLKPNNGAAQDESSNASIDSEELGRLRSTVTHLHEELKLAKAHSEEFQSLSQANERALREASEFSQECLQKLETFEADKQRQFEGISAQLATANNRIAQLEEEISHLQQNKHAILKESEEVREKVAKYDVLKGQLQEKESFFTKQLTEARQQIQIENSKYQQELLAHASDIQALEKVRQESSALLEELSAQKAKVEDSASQNALLERELREQKQVLSKQIDEFDFKITELGRQNEILLSQIENLSKNVPSTSANGENEMDEVLRFLRKEKEILSCKNDVLTQENRRISSQLSQASQELASLREALEDEKQKHELSSQMAKEYNSLLERVNSLNILQESNATLRQESEKYRTKCASLSSRIENLCAELEPLKSEKAAFSAEIQALKHQIQTLHQENQQWKSRLNQLVDRSDVIDVAKYRQLEETNQRLAKQLEELPSITEQRDSLQEKYSQLEARSKKLAQMCQSLKMQISQQTTSPSSKEASEIAELKDKLSELLQEKTKIEEKATKLAVLAQKATALKALCLEKDAECEKKIQNLKTEHQLHISLLHSQYKAKEKRTATPPQPQQELIEEPSKKLRSEDEVYQLESEEETEAEPEEEEDSMVVVEEEVTEEEQAKESIEQSKEQLIEQPKEYTQQTKEEASSKPKEQSSPKTTTSSDQPKEESPEHSIGTSHLAVKPSIPPEQQSPQQQPKEIPPKRIIRTSVLSDPSALDKPLKTSAATTRKKASRGGTSKKKWTQ